MRQFEPDAKPSRADCVYRLALGYEDERSFPELLDQFVLRRPIEAIRSR